jgi:hypothetical protein
MYKDSFVTLHSDFFSSYLIYHVYYRYATFIVTFKVGGIFAVYRI